MTRKFKFFSFLFIFLFILFVLGAMNVEKKNTNPFIQLIESILPEKMTMTIHLDCYARTDCKPEVLSGVETGNRIPHDE